MAKNRGKENMISSFFLLRTKTKVAERSRIRLLVFVRRAGFEPA